MKRILIFYALILDCILAAGLFLYFGLDWYWILIPFLILILITGFFAWKIQLNIFVGSIHKGNPTEFQIALSFDDGPNPVYTPQILDLLEKYNAKASFFLIGKQAEKYPHLVQRIWDEKHCIGNHSFTHANTIGFKSQAGWIKEINSTNEILKKIIGKQPRFFRPPFGITTPHLRGALARTQMVSIGWSHRTYDTIVQNVEGMYQKILQDLQPGIIILMHDSHERILPLLEQLLPELARRNVRFVTVNELINEEPYHEI